MERLPREVSNLLKNTAMQKYPMNRSCWNADNLFKVKLEWDKTQTIKDDNDSDVEFIRVDEPIITIEIDSDVEIIEETNVENFQTLNTRNLNVHSHTDLTSDLFKQQTNVSAITLDDNNNIVVDLTSDNTYVQPIDTNEPSSRNYRTIRIQGKPNKRRIISEDGPVSSEPLRKRPTNTITYNCAQTAGTRNGQLVPVIIGNENQLDTYLNYPSGMNKEFNHELVTGRSMDMTTRQNIYAMQMAYPDKSDFSEHGMHTLWEIMSTDRHFFDVYLLKINSNRYKARKENRSKYRYVRAAESLPDHQVIQFEHGNPSVDEVIAQKETMQNYIECLFHMRGHNLLSDDYNKTHYDVANYQFINQMLFEFLSYMIIHQKNKTVRIPKSKIPTEMFIRNGLVTLNRARNLFSYIFENKFAYNLDNEFAKTRDIVMYNIKILDSLKKLVQTVLGQIGSKLGNIPIKVKALPCVDLQPSAGLSIVKQPPDSPIAGPSHGRQPPDSPIAGPSHGKQPPDSPIAGPSHGKQPSDSTTAGQSIVKQLFDSPTAGPSIGKQPSDSPTAGPSIVKQSLNSPTAGPSHGKQPPDSPDAGSSISQKRNGIPSAKPTIQKNSSDRRTTGSLKSKKTTSKYREKNNRDRNSSSRKYSSRN